ncbi:MAG TPA: MmgE/PrpD family protein [Burkholderiales bacterium]|nr:MmgE/PrpD family protein [Burkholderiales bacterium]
MSGAQPPLLENATRDLAAFASRLKYDDLPREVVERMKDCVLDSIGCCLHGVTLPWTRKVQEMVLAEGATPVASLFGGGGRTSVSQAVLVNSTAGHAFELDDIHKESIIHPGSLALPVAVALAEPAGAASGRDLITAMVAGYEVGTRVGNAATMSLFLRGFHPQGTSGAFVASATAGRMLGLDPAQMQHALGITGSQAGGLMAAQEGAMVKRFHCGRAAQSGVYSALLARRGFTGIANVLEAPYGGYLSSLSGKPAPARLTAGLGTEWETAKVGYKPHAAVTSIHTALDALADLMRENKLSADDIKRVDAGLSHMTHVHCAWKYEAQGVTAAQMNLAYGLAVIALDGAAFVEQYREDRLRDPRILDFIQRIEARVDPEIEAMGPAFRHAARLKVETRDGRVIEREILHRRGSPENPLEPADIEYKFRNVTRGLLAPRRIERVIELAKTLDKQADTRELIAILAAPPGEE